MTPRSDSVAEKVAGAIQPSTLGPMQDAGQDLADDAGLAAAARSISASSLAPPKTSSIERGMLTSPSAGTERSSQDRMEPRGRADVTTCFAGSSTRRIKPVPPAPRAAAHRTRTESIHAPVRQQTKHIPLHRSTTTRKTAASISASATGAQSSGLVHSGFCVPSRISRRISCNWRRARAQLPGVARRVRAPCSVSCSAR